MNARLAGVTAYGTPATPSRGVISNGLNAELWAVTARLQKRAERGADGDKAAYAAALVAVGDVDRAIQVFEALTVRRPLDAVVANDLSAAYATRAERFDADYCWPRALAAADRALASDPAFVEARFNRALALESMGLSDAALAAWTDYRALEKQGEWSAEADHRARALQQLVTRRREPIAREVVESAIGEWAAAVERGDREAAAPIAGRAMLAAQDLAANRAESMPLEALQAVQRLARTGSVSELQALASAHRLYATAWKELPTKGPVVASGTMSRAEEVFKRAGSPYAIWGAIFRSIAARVENRLEKATSELAAVPEPPERWSHARGRFYWTRGVALEFKGDLHGSRRDLVLAAQSFQDGGDAEGLSAVQTLLADIELELGNRNEVWGLLLGALRTANANGLNPWRMLIYGSRVALVEQYPGVALAFQNSVIRTIERTSDALNKPDAYRQRANIQLSLGAREQALADTVLATDAAQLLPDAGLRQKSLAEITVIRSELMAATDPAGAEREADRALAYFGSMHLVDRVPRLLLIKARCRLRLGDRDGAHTLLHRASDAFDRERTALGALPLIDRMRALAQSREVVAELAEFEVTERQDYDEALAVIEQHRARATLDDFGTARGSTSSEFARERDLPADTMVVYYAVVADRTVAWAITNRGVRHFVTRLSRLRLIELVGALNERIEADATLDAIAAESGELFRELLAPALAAGGNIRRLIIVPDGPLWNVPFAALLDGDRPIAEKFVVNIAPSLATLRVASERLAAFAPRDVLAMGDGHDVRQSGLPRLPGADVEADLVGGVYPTSDVRLGASATGDVLTSSKASVIHFAGHAVADPRFPRASRLLVAPRPASSDDGVLSALQIATAHLPETSVVMLASCEGAAGMQADGEGAISLAHMFFAAGVPSVVATLWKVDDRSTPLVVDFHRALQTERDPGSALRMAQLSFLHATRDRPVRTWAGFIAFGGFRPDDVP